MFTIQTSFKPLLLKGMGGVKSVSRGDYERIARGKTFVPITSKNSASAGKPGKVGKVGEVSQHRTFLDRPENLSNLPVATM